ncbi:MBOAT family O-acyltransferase [Flavobacterium selenitireducens]|uniref:MBOAT family O-acyltransferase n=1 Tax=Flavobacterium selenitireducens TaxID=2722704 RepID=UPI00168B15BD|nr:MBOAT family protein [Flavobacterium selenitireducens]MBD3581090.1 MBOAT family protein [Flavobacterium selenitireducens]
MVFNSYTFIVFFAIMLVLHYLPFTWKTKKINLLLGSYVFYAAWNPPFILLLWLSTVIDFFVGRKLYHEENKTRKKVLLVVSLIGNLGMLCFFKYGEFLLENFVALVNLFGMDYHPADPGIILPAGISFYTFTTLCYTIDMYKKESQPVKSLLDFSLFVTFFPHLVAGPIVRPPQLVPQFEHPKLATTKQFLDGLLLLSVGLFMKVVVADSLLASTADAVFNAPMPLAALDSWTGVLAFSGQIFMDFAGYSTCAIGVAMCLGFSLPQNFNNPYAAIGFSDFWKRWHITLSAWLRDYLYIPLGGNRKGKVRMYMALMLTMLLGGLWHGASWTFVVWGGLHGFYLWAEKFISEKRNANGLAPVRKTGLTGFSLAMLTFLLICITWVFFRADTFGKAGMLLLSMAGFFGSEGFMLLSTTAILKVAIVIPCMLLLQWMMRNRQLTHEAYRLSWWKLGVAWSFLVLMIVWAQESGSAFIYFQF